MTSSLSNFINNLSEGIHKIKCKYIHNDKKCETYKTEIKHCNIFLEYTNFKIDLIEYLYFCCDKNYEKKFDKKLKEGFFNTYNTFFNHDNNKFVLLLQKGVYPYEYMDDLENFSKKPLSEKELFYSHLNMEDITDADNALVKRVCKDFEIKNL